MAGTLAQFALTFGLLLAPVAVLSLIDRCATGRPVRLRWCLRRRRARPAVQAMGRPIQVVAADLRRLSRQLALVPAGAPLVRWQALWAAYDDVLLEAAAQLDVPHELPTTPNGMARDLERLRLLAALEGAGLAVQGLTSAGPRVFFAVDPPEVARADLDRALDRLRGSPGEPRWIPSGRWHLTLLFLGTVPADRVKPLVAAAAPAVAAAPPMTLRLAGAGRFGSSRRPQVFWAGLEGDVREVTELARRLAAAARALRLPVEDRRFRAHLTVGRWRPQRPADGALPEQLADYRGPEWPVPEVRLLESHLGPAPRYEALASWPVG